jgi:hypothetical protein
MFIVSIIQSNFEEDTNLFPGRGGILQIWLIPSALVSVSWMSLIKEGKYERGSFGGVLFLLLRVIYHLVQN